MACRHPNSPQDLWLLNPVWRESARTDFPNSGCPQRLAVLGGAVFYHVIVSDGDHAAQKLNGLVGLMMMDDGVLTIAGDAQAGILWQNHLPNVAGDQRSAGIKLFQAGLILGWQSADDLANFVPVFVQFHKYIRW